MGKRWTSKGKQRTARESKGKHAYADERLFLELLMQVQDDDENDGGMMMMVMMMMMMLRHIFYILAMEGRSFGLVTEPKAIEFKNRVWVGDLLVW